MDISFILLILGFLIVTYLIFKFIKKIIWAVFSFIFLIILIIGSVIGLAVLDVNNLASHNDFNVNLFYGDSENVNFGMVIPIENKSPILDKVKDYDMVNFNLEKFKDDDKDFYIFISKDSYNSLLKSDSIYYLIGTENLTYQKFKINAGLTKDELIKILNSDNAKIDYVDIVYNKNKKELSFISEKSAKSIFEKLLNDNLKQFNIGLKQALFVSSFKSIYDNSNEKIIPTILADYKNETIEIYPDRFTFKLVRLMPMDIIMEYLPNNMDALE